MLPPKLLDTQTVPVSAHPHSDPSNGPSGRVGTCERREEAQTCLVPFSLDLILSLVVQVEGLPGIWDVEVGCGQNGRRMFLQ